MESMRAVLVTYWLLTPRMEVRPPGESCTRLKGDLGAGEGVHSGGEALQEGTVGVAGGKSPVNSICTKKGKRQGCLSLATFNEQNTLGIASGAICQFYSENLPCSAFCSVLGQRFALSWEWWQGCTSAYLDQENLGPRVLARPTMSP